MRDINENKETNDLDAINKKDVNENALKGLLKGLSFLIEKSFKITFVISALSFITFNFNQGVELINNKNIKGELAKSIINNKGIISDYDKHSASINKLIDNGIDIQDEIYVERYRSLLKCEVLVKIGSFNDNLCNSFRRRSVSIKLDNNKYFNEEILSYETLESKKDVIELLSKRGVYKNFKEDEIINYNIFYYTENDDHYEKIMIDNLKENELNIYKH